MNETPTPEQRDQRRSIKIILALTALVAAGVAFLPSAPSETPTAAQIQHRLAMLTAVLVITFLGAAAALWRLASNEEELLRTHPPEGPDPPPILRYRYVPRRERPAYFRVVAVTLVLCAIALEYLAWRFDAILSR